MANSANTPANTPALLYLQREKIWHVVRTYNHEGGGAMNYGMEASTALQLPPQRVLKTLMVQADHTLFMTLLPVHQRLQLKAAARALGVKKLQLADPNLAQRLTGYVLGGISPLGQKNRHRAIIDSSCQQFDTVYISGGGRGINVEIKTADLIAAVQGQFADIAAHAS